MYERGEPLNPQAVRWTWMPLYLAAHRYCGGWAQALRMAGIDPAKVYVRQMKSVIRANEGDASTPGGGDAR